MSTYAEKKAEARERLNRLLNDYKQCSHFSRPEPSSKEAQALSQLRDNLSSKKLLPLPDRLCHCGDEDSALLRFLHARKLDVKKAEKMLEETLEYRSSNDLHSALERQFDPEITSRMRAAQPNAYYGQDRAGRPLYLEFTGHVKSDAIVDLGLDSVTSVHISAMEFLNQILCREASVRNGEVVHQVTAVMDARNLTLAKARRLLSGNIFSTLSKIDSDHYPETMARTIVINAPRVASAVFSLAAPFLDAKTREKIHIVNEKQTALQTYVDLKYIPKAMGGQAEDEELENIGREATSTQVLQEVVMEESARRKANGEPTIVDELEQADRARAGKLSRSEENGNVSAESGGCGGKEGSG